MLGDNLLIGICAVRFVTDLPASVYLELTWRQLMGNTTINPKRSWETNFNERFQAARQGLLKLLSEVEGLSSIADAQSTGVSTKTALPAPDPPAFARRLADAAAVLEMRVKG